MSRKGQKYNRIDFNHLDWSKSSAELSLETGYRSNHLQNIRDFCILSKEEINEKYKIDIDKIDWTIINKNIAKKYKQINPAQISILRKRFGKARLPVSKYIKKKRYRRFSIKIRHFKNCLRKSKIDWSKVDWNLRDVDIARVVNVSRERIRQVRNKLNKDPSPLKWKSTGSIKLKQFLLENKEKLNNLPLILIIMFLEYHGFKNFTEGTKLVIKCKKSGIKTFITNGVYIHYLMNWDLPNADLDEIWQTAYNYAGSTRYENKELGSSKWRRSKRNYKFDKKLKKSLKKEKDRAQRYKDIFAREDIEGLIQLYREGTHQVHLLSPVENKQEDIERYDTQRI